MIGFSANLGFLWTELPLPQAIRAAKAAGFVAVECHWPYDTDPGAVRAALEETGLPMLGLNTRRGDVAAGDFGLSACPGREGEAREAIREAVDYAAAVGARAVHVMAGKAKGPEANGAFKANLRFACDLGKEAGVTILIEPLNPFDAPGYFLEDTAQAAEILSDLGRDNLRIMFDCYHVARRGDDVMAELPVFAGSSGHIQFAGVPSRGRPDEGTLDYRAVFDLIRDLGWRQPLGAEYRPGGPTEATLGWMKTLAV